LLFKPYPGRRNPIDLLQSIAPVFRLDVESGYVHLVGTGFWVTEVGHIITARHVLDENIHRGVDRGPIFAVQAFADRSVAVRNFVKSDLHPLFDLALSQTIISPGNVDQPTAPVVMSIDDLKAGDEVFSFAVLSDGQKFDNEVIPGVTTACFDGSTFVTELSVTADIRFSVRLSFGSVTEVFPERRDKTIYPYPCVQSNVPIYGGNSGAPLFDVRGRVRAISASSYEGTDISFHIPTYCALDLQTTASSTGLVAAGPDQKSLLDLAIRQRICFRPPLLDFDQPIASAAVWIKYVLGSLLRLGVRPLK